MSKAREDLKKRVFLGGVARRPNLCDLLTKVKELVEQEVAHTGVLAVFQGKWGTVENISWDAAGLAVADRPERRLVVVGEDGDYFTYLGATSVFGQLDPRPRMIRRAGTIDGYVFACGMAREVYKRLDTTEWMTMHAPAPEEDEVAGFEDIDGYSENEIYCCGWNGEIWHFDGKAWARYGGMTNLILGSLCCAEDGNVYVVGQQGILIKGRGDQWDVIELDDDFSEDLWDVNWFEGELYVTSMTGLYTLQGSTLEEIEMDDILNTSFYRLSRCEGVLWSIGSSDVLSFDGSDWQRYT